MSKQILLGNMRYHSISPSMSVKSIRLASSIDPSLRVFTRLIYTVLNKDSSEDIRKMTKIPLTSVPYIPYSSPIFFSFIMQWIRNKVDIKLIRRKMRKSNPNLRTRLVNSINNYKLYRAGNSVEAVTTWFENNHLGKLARGCVDIVRNRKNGKSWPLSTFDITSIASVNIEMDFITQLKQKNRN